MASTARRDSKGRLRRSSSNAGQKGLPSKDGARTGRPLSLVPPEHLTTDGKQWYRWAVALAVEMGIGDEADSQAFELAAENFADMRAAQQHVDQWGQVLEGTDAVGNTILRRNPSVQIVANCRAMMRMMYSDLGLTPAARAKFAPGSAQEQDPFEALLSG